MSYARQMLDVCRPTFNVDVGLLAATIETRAACPEVPALLGVRRGLPPLRARLPGVAERHQ